MVTYSKKNKITDYGFLGNSMTQGSNPLPVAGGARPATQPMDWGALLASMFQAAKVDPAKQPKPTMFKPAAQQQQQQLGAPTMPSGILSALMTSFGSAGSGGILDLLQNRLK